MEAANVESKEPKERSCSQSQQERSQSSSFAIAVESKEQQCNSRRESSASDASRANSVVLAPTATPPSQARELLQIDRSIDATCATYENKPGETRNTFKVEGSLFDVDWYYKPIQHLGTGAYGVVCSCYDARKGPQSKTAIKKFPNVFENLLDAKRVVREIKLMRHFNHHNIVKLVDIIPPPDWERFEDLYCVSELMHTDLHKVIHSKRSISEEQVQYWMYQLLRGIQYMHACHVIHRDLKPSNVLIDSVGRIKICDFGLSRGVSSQTVDLTEYVVTRYYRAPEVICCSSNYNKLVDLWSAGCILAELIIRKTLFPGKDYIHQLALIFDLIGSPTPEEIETITNPQALHYVRTMPTRQRADFSKLLVNPKFKNMHHAVDLLDKLLTFTPEKRLSAEEAIMHPFFDKFRKQQVIERNPFDFRWEETTNTKKELQEQYIKEMLTFRDADGKSKEVVNPILPPMQLPPAAGSQVASTIPPLPAGCLAGTAIPPLPAAGAAVPPLPAAGAAIPPLPAAGAAIPPLPAKLVSQQSQVQVKLERSQSETAAQPTASAAAHPVVRVAAVQNQDAVAQQQPKQLVVLVIGH